MKECIQKLFKSAKKKLGMTKIVRPSDKVFLYARDWVDKEFGEGHSVGSIGVDTIQDRIYLEVGDDNSGEFEEFWIDLPEKLKL